jgi:uncharacterized damage-inducible protein DinB
MKPFLAFAAIASLFGQDATISADTKNLYEMTRTNIMKSAEKIPEDLYSFRPVPEVRSVAELFGHIAEAQYLFCSPLKGEPQPKVKIEKAKTAKAELTAALKEAFEYCDAVYNKATDAAMGDKVKFFNRERTKSGVMQFNSIHNYEHYGNLVTYMRLKGIVPPSSEGR